MSALVPKNGKLRQLDREAEPVEQFTNEQTQDSARLSRALNRLLRDVAKLTRRYNEPFIEHEDVVFDATGSVTFRLPHHLGGPVRYWVTSQRGFSAAPNLNAHASSDNNTLVLTSTVAGTATVRIVRAG